MDKKWMNSALNCEVFSSFEGVFSDHRIVIAKICFDLRRNAAQTIITAHYDRSLLNNKDVCDKYTITLINKFDAQQEISEKPIPNDECENFINVHIEAVAEWIPTKLRAKHRILCETLEVKKKVTWKPNSNAIGENQRSVTYGTKLSK